MSKSLYQGRKFAVDLQINDYIIYLDQLWRVVTTPVQLKYALPVSKFTIQEVSGNSVREVTWTNQRPVNFVTIISSLC